MTNPQTAEEQAQTIYDNFMLLIHDPHFQVMSNAHQARQLTIACVNEIKSALWEYDTNNGLMDVHTYEDQNMDWDKRWWTKVFNAITQLPLP
jgi:hypothetical protein